MSEPPFDNRPDPAEPPPTRADLPAPPPTRADAPAPPPTRADPPAPPPTQADPSAARTGAGTRADGVAADAPAEPFVAHRLPPALADRYGIVQELPRAGQAALLLCRNVETDDRVVVKVYDRTRPGIEDVWALWQETGDTRYIAELVEPPFVLDQRSYEVTRYVPARSLDDRPEGRYSRMPAAQLEAVLAQVAGALDHIHNRLSRMLVHRDIKPSNLLVVSWDPIEVRLTDFGIAVAQTHTVESRETHSRTPAYAAPEAASQSGPRQDWWSLGMTLAELHQGHHPYYDVDLGAWMSPGRIDASVRTERVPLDDDLDPRWATLLRGLLTRDPSHRWGYAQVQAWLRGEPVAVHDEADEPQRAPTAGRPFVFAGEVVHRPAELAALITDGRWRQAAQLVISPEWADLRDWADAVGIGPRVEQLHTRFVEPGRAVDRIVAELLTALDPGGHPVFRDRDADPPQLVQLAAEASGDAGEEARRLALVDLTALFDSGALRALAALDGWSRLAQVDDRWHRWCARVAELRTEVLPPEAELPGAGVERVLLLAAAADADTAAMLQQRARSLRTRRNLRVAWFRRLAERADGDDPTPAHLTMIFCADLVQDERLRIRPETHERVERLVRETLPERVQQARARSRRTARQLLRSGPLLACAVGYTGLAAVAGVGVGVATYPVEGLLTTGVLLLAGLCLYAGMAFPRRRFTDALLTAWAGAWAGLLAGALLGAFVGTVVKPEAGWPTFWSTWVVLIVAGAAVGTAQ